MSARQFSRLTTLIIFVVHLFSLIGFWGFGPCAWTSLFVTLSSALGIMGCIVCCVARE